MWAQALLAAFVSLHSHSYLSRARSSRAKTLDKTLDDAFVYSSSLKNFENDDQRFGVRSMHSDQIFFLFFRKKGWPSKSFEIIIVVVVGKDVVPCFQPTGRLLREDEEEKLLLFFEHQNRGDNFGIIEQY